MSGYGEDRLYELLPAIHRIRDEERGFPLRTVLRILGGQADVLDDDIGLMYENWFIETCDPWAVPYIGDLLGIRGLRHTTGEQGGRSLRSFVANTLAYRRRKGTASVLEQLAFDVTGWPARAVEFFQRLATTQHLDHARPDNRSPASLRDALALERLDTAFDGFAHTADVRRTGQGRGKYNIPNVGLFLWRLKPIPIERGAPSEAGGGLFRFSPLGHDLTLFSRARPEGDIAHLATPVDVPAPLTRRGLAAHLHEGYYGPGGSLRVFVNGVEEAAPAVCDLSDAAPPVGETEAWSNQPADDSGRVAIDPVLGRLALEPGRADAQVEVTYRFGFSAEMGGGGYDRRRQAVADADTDDEDSPPVVYTVPGTDDSLDEAVLTWRLETPAQAVIEIRDSGLYRLTADIELLPGQQLVLRAAPEQRPTVELVPMVEEDPPTPHRPLMISVSPPSESEIETGPTVLVLDGLLLTGRALEVTGELAQMVVRDCTLVPGHALSTAGEPAHPGEPSISIVDESLVTTSVEIDHSIVGPLRLAAHGCQLTARDSIIDGLGEAALAGEGGQPGPTAVLERATVLGSVHVRELTLASEVVFTGPVVAERRQVGCVRFSALPDPGSHTPRRFRCQPDRALHGVTEPVEQDAIRARLRPSFVSLDYGHRTGGYAQLALSCADEIRTGAEDGSEMGAFCELKQPQREANLRAALDEYLRVGLDAGIVYVT